LAGKFHSFLGLEPPFGPINPVHKASNREHGCAGLIRYASLVVFFESTGIPGNLPSWFTFSSQNGKLFGAATRLSRF
jgi:hypothetical protein